MIRYLVYCFSAIGCLLLAGCYAKGDVVAVCSGVDDTTNLSSAIVAANGDWVVIKNGSICASSDLTIPNLKVLKGGLLKPLTNHTVILGTFQAGLYPTFTNAGKGLGTVLFHAPPITADGQTGVNQAYPQWWDSCVADYTHDCAPALTAAINSGARRIFLPGGGYGLASPVSIESNNFTLEGDSRVYTDILPLAVDIHQGNGPNALLINAQRTCSPQSNAICLPTNCIIEKIRFFSYIPFTGWGIWAEDGVQGGEALFSSIIKDCWVSMGHTAQGFFHGGLNDSFIENLDVENTGFVFHLQGGRIGSDTFSNIHVLYGTEPVIYSTASPSTMMHVHGLTISSQQQQTVIAVTDGTDWNIDGVTLDYDSGGTVAGGLGQFNNCTRLLFSNFIARRTSGNMSGISLRNTTGKIQSGYIYDARPTTDIPEAILITGTSDIDVMNVSVLNGTAPDLGLADTVDVRVEHCRFINTAAAAVLASGAANLSIRDSEILNSSYGAATALPMIHVASSGRFICLNNTIGVNDPLAVPNGYFLLRGTGVALINGNALIGGLNFSSPGTNQNYRGDNWQL